MNNLSLSSNHECIQAFYYKIQSKNEDNNNYDSSIIFIPSLKLEISENGLVLRLEGPRPSKEAALAVNSYFTSCDTDGVRFDFKSVVGLLKTADRNAHKNVQVPLKMAKEIELLVEQKELHPEKAIETDKSIAALSIRLFESVLSDKK